MPIDMESPSISKISYTCLLRLQSVYDSLKSAEKKAADYLLAQPESFATDSIVEVAAKAGCSEATLVRLGHRLDFNGYAELKAAVLADVEDETAWLYQGIHPEDDAVSVMKKVFDSSTQSIEDTFKLIDTDAYIKAVDVLRHAKKIQFVGVGDAAVVAEAGHHKFFRLGLNVNYSRDYDMSLMIASQMEPGDVVIAISHSGRTETTLKTLRCAKDHGATILSVTNAPFSPIGKHADILLLTAAFGQKMMGEAMTKRIPSLCIIESLYINVLHKISAGQTEALERASEALLKNKL